VTVSSFECRGRRRRTSGPWPSRGPRGVSQRSWCKKQHNTRQMQLKIQNNRKRPCHSTVRQPMSWEGSGVRGDGRTVIERSQRKFLQRQIVGGDGGNSMGRGRTVGESIMNTTADLTSDNQHKNNLKSHIHCQRRRNQVVPARP